MDIDPRLRAAAAADAGQRQASQPDNPSRGEYPEPPGEADRRGDGPGGGYYTPSHTQHPPQPQSFHHTTPPTDPLSDLRRPRACEACRQLKVRCEPDAGHPTGSCRRCAKAGRNCVVTVPTRKRQKKTDSRVAELEKKIDALSASFQGQGQGQGPGPAEERSGQGQQGGRRWLGGMNGGAGLAGSKRRLSGEVKEDRSEGVDLRRHSLWKPERHTEAYDVIDRGSVDVDTANAAFERYVNDMAPQIPIVVFPPGTKMEDVRRSKPVLLHAIIAIAIGPFQPSAQAGLVHDFYKVIAERTVVSGEKSLELVQAVMVSWIWYMPPDHFEELKFYHLIHMAVVMGMDIGMNRRTMTNRMAFSLMRDLLGKKSASLDPDAPETRRAWLGCYFGSVQYVCSVCGRRNANV
jgi:hypothetical protein